MTPGEIHGLHKQVVDDLKAQLAAARDDARNERTRAEAAEQELRDYTAHVAQSKNEDRSKLAAISAHLPALKRLHAWVSSERMGEWTYLEGGTFYGDVQEMAAVVADALEALEP